MKYELVIFDLDGTLLDTLDDLAAAADHALTGAGFPTKSREAVRRLIGNGVARLIRGAVPEGTPEEICQRVLADYKAYYTANVNVRTRPFPGVVELLRDLRGAGVRVAVNSNKPDAATRALCQAHFAEWIDLALGERPDIPKKPAPDGARHIMDALGVAPERTLYVGDGDTDLLTAQNAGLDAAWVSWGYRRAGELGDLEIPRAFDDAEALGRFILDAGAR